MPKKSNKAKVPEKLKEGIENLSGFSMDDMKVHYNSDEPQQVDAFASGNNIHLAPNQEKNLPQEAWHVVQQKREKQNQHNKRM